MCQTITIDRSCPRLHPQHSRLPDAALHASVTRDSALFRCKTAPNELRAVDAVLFPPFLPFAPLFIHFRVSVPVIFRPAALAMLFPLAGASSVVLPTRSPRWKELRARRFQLKHLYQGRLLSAGPGHGLQE